MYSKRKVDMVVQVYAQCTAHEMLGGSTSLNACTRNLYRQPLRKPVTSARGIVHLSSCSSCPPSLRCAPCAQVPRRPMHETAAMQRPIAAQEPLSLSPMGPFQVLATPFKHQGPP